MWRSFGDRRFSRGSRPSRPTLPIPRCLKNFQKRSVPVITDPLASVGEKRWKIYFGEKEAPQRPFGVPTDVDFIQFRILEKPDPHVPLSLHF